MCRIIRSEKYSGPVPDFWDARDADKRQPDPIKMPEIQNQQAQENGFQGRFA
jgi:hypothetical protein